MIHPIVSVFALIGFLTAIGMVKASETNDILPTSSVPVTAQADRADESIGHCVRTNRIRQTRILDDQTILLEMAGDSTLVMHLKHRCPQLSFHGFFSYEPTLGQLCAELDHIVTRAGFHCDISHFSLYEKDNETKS